MTIEQVTRILDWHNKILAKDLAKQIDVIKSMVWNTQYLYKKWSATHVVNSINRGMVPLFEQYNANKQKENNTKTPDVTNHIELTIQDPFDMLEKARSAFDNTLIVFIQTMVEQKVSAVRKENEQLKQTIDRLQKENNDYNEAFVKLKSNNLVETLKKTMTAFR